ncbi:TRAP transporter permease [Salipiger bermudensis]|uniref:TRAP transporter permease n=1 Tax=Salipiger bermudensis TaxID=344736 RepID=UPI001CD689D3|nr:TRAP transporter fused permease subunit [Salipiger bermudensis]MCA0964868.1 TRAP transporter fused permease subunit [Salipiger bermudensis]
MSDPHSSTVSNHQTTADQPAAPPAGAGMLHGPTRVVVLVLGLVALLLNVDRLFNTQMLIGYVLLDTSYFYLLAGIFLSIVFQVYPLSIERFGIVGRSLDITASALVLGCAAFFAWNGERILMEGWDLVAPVNAQIIAGIFCLLTLEALRRAGGLVLLLICGTFFLFPLFAESMPGFLWGPGTDIPGLVMMHALGSESIIGVPMRVVAGLLVGFLVFGSALVVTGGGAFFMSFAEALLGRTRGGPSKVAILSSGFFGSLSGSVISNIVTTGQMTIPTMKKVGYPPRYAAAIEACASTGGALMPPVMGAVAFIMAENLNVAYSTVMIAAIVPAALFYFALMLQTDCYAARRGLKGQNPADLPKVWPVLKSGWHFLLSLVVLVYLIVAQGIEAQAPFYATLVLLVTSTLNGWIRGENRVTFRLLIDLLEDSIRNIANIVGILAGVGLIVGALSYTGVGGAFSRELLQFAGDNIYLLLVFGALTSFVLGMGMTVSACYIFLAIVLGPAMAGAGLNPIAGHLFILYWGMLSYITPPVALAAFAAAVIAKSDGMRTGILAMRLGAVNFVLPFIFVLNPTLVLQGEPLAILHDVGSAVLAVWFMSAASEGWLHFVGRMSVPARITLGAAAVTLVVPGSLSDLIGLALLGAAIVINRFTIPGPARSPAHSTD